MKTMAATGQQSKSSSGVCSKIQATVRGGFAAVLEDGSVVTWGPLQTLAVTVLTVQDQLKGVQQVQASSGVPLLRFWQMDPSLRGVLQRLCR